MASPPAFETCAVNKIVTISEESIVLKRLKQAQWLRAAMLGASDGLLSTATLMLGIGAAKEDRESMILSGVAGALAGAFSMAVGEFVSVSTQRDIELAAITKCNSGDNSDSSDGNVKIKIQIDSRSRSTHGALPKTAPVPLQHEMPPAVSPGQHSFTRFHAARSPVMKAVAEDVRASMQDQDICSREANTLPNPYKAGAASGLAFVCGSLVPLVTAIIISHHRARIITIVTVTSIALALSGGIGACFGGSKVTLSAMRVLIGGWISMAITYWLLKSIDHDHDAD